MKLKEIIAEKRLWNAHTKRVKQLPKDYQIVYKEITKYLYAIGVDELNSGFDIFLELTELFESGVHANKSVLEITGEDVGSFCDDLIGSRPNLMERVEAETNQIVHNGYTKSKK